MEYRNSRGFGRTVNKISMLVKHKLVYSVLVCVCVTCAVRAEALQVGKVPCVLPRVSHSKESSQVGVGDVRRKTQSSPLELNPRLKPRSWTRNTGNTRTTFSNAALF